MKRVKIEILKKFSDSFEIGDTLEIEIDESGRPLSPFWRRSMMPDLAIAGYVKTKKPSKIIENIGDNNE